MRVVRLKVKGNKKDKVKKYLLGNLFQGVLSGQGSGLNSTINNFSSNLESKMPEGTNTGLGLSNAMSSFTQLKADDGKIDEADIGQTVGDFVAGSSQYGQVGKQIGNIATGIIGQDRTTTTLGEGVDYQKAGIQSMNKALEYGAAGAQYGGLPGAAIGAALGAGMGLVQGGKERRRAEQEFLKRRNKRIDRFDDASKNQYMDQYLNSVLYAKDGGIYIKPENKGKFTRYCKNKGYDKVTISCIKQGKKSKNKLTGKRAVFADNARKWNKA